MRLPFGTILMESAAGLALLAAAAVGFLLPKEALLELGPWAPVLAKVFLIVWPLPFLAMNLRKHPALRGAALAATGAAFAAAGLAAMSTGLENLFLPAVFGLGVILCGFSFGEETGTNHFFGIAAGAVIALYGFAHVFAHAFTGAAILVLGAFAAGVEARGASNRLGMAAAAAGAAGGLIAAFERFTAYQFVSAAALAACGAVFLYLCVHRVRRRRLALASVAGRDEAIYGNFNEIAFWLAISAIGSYAAFSREVFHDLFFLSVVAVILGYAAVKSTWSEGTPEAPKAFAAVIAMSLGFIAMMRATGGLLSPLVYITFAASFIASRVISAKSVGLGAMLYVGYFSFEAAEASLTGLPGARELVFRAVILSGIVLFTGLHTIITTRRHDAEYSRLQETKGKLEAALAKSVEFDVTLIRQTEQLRKANAESLEMRSALMNVLEDVEVSKKATERVNRRDEAIFFAVAEGLIAAGRDRNIFLFNPTAEVITGHAHDESIGKPVESVLKLVSEDSEVLQTELLNDAFSGRGGKLPAKMTVLRKDGRRVPVSGTAAPFFDDHGDLLGIVIVFRDVTSEREIDRQKSGFISIASHQLRTPLSGIRWFLDLLRGGDAGPLKPQQKEFVDDIYVSTTRMINLVNDLLNVSRLEQGRVLINPAPLDLGALIASIQKDHEPLLRKKNLKFTRTIDNDLPRVFADETAIRQALSNLVANAINYTTDGGKIGVTARSDGDMVTLEISDTGIGIAKSQQHRIFERFFRGDNAMMRETVGSGLGLHITKTVIESAGGSIKFASEEGKGTTFYVSLPVEASKGTLST